MDFISRLPGVEKTVHPEVNPGGSQWIFPIPRGTRFVSMWCATVQKWESLPSHCLSRCALTGGPAGCGECLLELCFLSVLPLGVCWDTCALLTCQDTWRTHGVGLGQHVGVEWTWWFIPHAWCPCSLWERHVLVLRWVVAPSHLSTLTVCFAVDPLLDELCFYFGGFIRCYDLHGAGSLLLQALAL